MIYWVFGPFSAAGTSGRNSGRGLKTEKHDFPELGALLGEKYVRPKSFSPELRTFFTFCVLAGEENRKMQFPGARGTLEEKIWLHQKFLPEMAQLFYIFRFPDRQGREIAKYWFLRPFWPQTALGT